MAVQPAVGILAQRRDRNDPFDCFDSFVAWVRLAYLKNELPSWCFATIDPSKEASDVLHWRFCMTTNNDEVISTLNDLIVTCRDGEKGFRTAAENVKGAELKTLFTRISQDRAQCATELQYEVRRLGGDPDQSGSVVGAIHRGWMDLKSAAAGDDRAIVTEAERGEDSSVKNFEEALKKNLPPDVFALVNQQYQQVKKTHDQIRALELSTGAAR